MVYSATLLLYVITVLFGAGRAKKLRPTRNREIVMGKWSFFFYSLFKLGSKYPEESFSFIVWLISAALEVGIFSLVIAGVAKLIDDKQDFGEWFGGSCIVLGIIEVILLIIGLCS